MYSHIPHKHEGVIPQPSCAFKQKTKQLGGTLCGICKSVKMKTTKHSNCGQNTDTCTEGVCGTSQVLAQSYVKFDTEKTCLVVLQNVSDYCVTTCVYIVKHLQLCQQGSLNKTVKTKDHIEASILSRWQMWCVVPDVPKSRLQQLRPQLLEWYLQRHAG